MAAELQRRAAGDDRITLQLSYLDDAQLVRRVGEAEVVVLPYRQMHNSGAALGALSMDRPVLVPANPVNADLAAEVGPGWVHTFTGPMTADVLSECVQALKTVERSAAPDLSAAGGGRAPVSSTGPHISPPSSANHSAAPLNELDAACAPD